jgi:EAL domain-containing protein (putative c-di-GMP-specific phosphodiesterase class I)
MWLPSVRSWIISSQRVSLALYSAKESGRNASRLFLPELRLAAQRKLILGTELRRAHEKGEFALYYQPQVDLAFGRIIGLEALLRWHHPDHGVLAPGEFLPVLEQGPLAGPVGNWILGEAIRQAARLFRAGHRLRMGINLFSAQLKSGNLEQTICELVCEASLPADVLELEITENTILKNDATILESLSRLRSLALGIAFDDYGTGYASLSC